MNGRPMDADDDQHAAARTAWQSLLEDREPLHVANYILVETTALLNLPAAGL